MRMTFTTIVVGLALLAGCDTGPRPPAGVGQEPVGVDQMPIATIDPALQKFLVIDYGRVVFSAPTAERGLFVQVPARSQADNEFAAQYNFEFFGADGVKVGETGFKTVVFPSRRSQLLSGQATTSNAVAWRLDIRSAR